MHKTFCLLSLELRSLYGINKFLHIQDPKEKNRCRLLLGVWVLLAAMVLFYVGALVYGLCSLGLADTVPAYLTALSSLLILVFGFFTAGNRIFGQHGYAILASMPISARSLVCSRFLSLYIQDLALALAVMLPGMVVYGFCRMPQPGFYLTALLSTLLIPAIPLVISVLLGTLVLAISTRMKHKSLVQSLLMVLFVLLVLLGSFRFGNAAGNFTPEALAQLAQTAAKLLGQIYPPAIWLGSALTQANMEGFFLFALVSLATMALAIYGTAHGFHAISRRLQTITARHSYQIGTLESRGLLKALYIREAKRYFSSSIYVTNTIIGPIMGAVMAVALCIGGIDSLVNALPLPLDIRRLLPYAFSAVFCMMTTSCTSISMEGKHFWVIKSMPIPGKTLLDRKLLLNLSLMLPFYLLSLIAMAIALKPDLPQLLWLILIPGSLMLFSTVFGITVNLKFHSFDWEKEETVVKQSLPAALGGFSGFFLSALLGIAACITPERFSNAVNTLLCLLTLALTALLYRKNSRIRLERL